MIYARKRTRSHPAIVYVGAVGVPTRARGSIFAASFLFYARVRRLKPITPVSPLKLQSAHPLRGATCTKAKKGGGGSISIHAPLAGCDMFANEQVLFDCHFNPRTPCGVRPDIYLPLAGTTAFQSTHPLRGATGRGCLISHLVKFQSTHPLRGATWVREPP